MNYRRRLAAKHDIGTYLPDDDPVEYMPIKWGSPGDKACAWRLTTADATMDTRLATRHGRLVHHAYRLFRNLYGNEVGYG